MFYSRYTPPVSPCPDQPALRNTVALADYNYPNSGCSASRIPLSLFFPLSTDHLITLIEFNVFRAFLTNLSLLSLLNIIYDECDDVPHISPLSLPSTIPPALAPTTLQRSIPHPLWIDTVPLAAMRNNLILTAGTYDEDEMCSDMLGSLFRGYKGSERRGLIVWGDPWDTDGWEVSDGFARKWSFLLKGCQELVDATNRWRAVRDEEPLVVEL